MAGISDEDLIQEFVAESRENLAVIEPDLLVLERSGAQTDPEIINRVFRAIHTIKGASGFFGFESLIQLSHIMENILIRIRDKTLVPQPEVIEPLLLGVDKLHHMLEDVHASNEVPCQEVILRLELILEDEPSEEADLTEAIPEANLPDGDAVTFTSVQRDPTTLNEAVAHGKKLYMLHIQVNRDLADKGSSLAAYCEQLASVGVVLDVAHQPDAWPGLETCLETDVAFVVLFASVLEADLLDMALDLPDVPITKVTVQDVLPADTPVAQPEPEMAQTVADKLPSKTPDKATLPKEEASGKASGEAAETVRIKVDLLNTLMDLASELVLSRNQLLRTSTTKSETSHKGLDTIVQNVNHITTSLQEHIMQTRMQPLGTVFAKFPRVVRDMSRALGKEIELVTTGEDVELDKSIVESLSAPLTHLIRNCCDHAIELPAEREGVGKPRNGTIWLQAYQEGGQINITITDDGKGIDADRIANKAIQSGIVSKPQVEAMSTNERINLIFLPGFSTAEEVTDISGRGVGMDVVKTNIERLGGQIILETVLGEGTTFTLCLPLTMAIIPSLIIGAAGHRFAVPQMNLVELVCIRAHEISSRIEKVGPAAVLRLRNELLPLLRLSEMFQLKQVYMDAETGEIRIDRRHEIADAREELLEAYLELPSHSNSPQNRRLDWKSNYNILVLQVGAYRFGLIVDELFDMEDIVVKPLPSFFQANKCFAGVTILGDGRVATILDASGILQYSKLSFSEIERAEEKKAAHQDETTTVRLSHRQEFVLFQQGTEELLAFPVHAVLRLERFKPGEIDRMGQREFLTYRDGSLPLVRLSNYLPIQPNGHDGTEAYLLVSRNGDDTVGIVASNIVDIVELDKNQQESTVKQSGISGSVVYNNRLTLVIHPQELFEQIERKLGEDR